MIAAQQTIGLDITLGSYPKLLERIVVLAKDNYSSNVCIANVHMLVEAHNNDAFRSDINKAEVITADGKPLTWALRLLYGIKQDRVAGMDLLPDLLKQAMVNKLPVYFYGGTESLLEKTKNYMALHYPDLRIAGMTSPPFREITAAEEEEAVQMINKSGARMVFVILGCPKQEKWMARMKKRINAVMIGVGGALPVMLGIQKRAPKWMQDAGLEWLFRLFQEPRRLFKRYAYTNTLFIWLLCREYFRIKVFRKSQTHHLN